MATLTESEAWSAVAQAWDAHVDDVDAHSRSATAALLDRLAVQPGERVLELAAGPGSLAATWSRLVGPSGRVVVSDLAPGMVEAAARRVEAQGLGNVEVRVLDASAVDEPDASFDVVACRMGLMFTPDPAAALAEMRRVLAPGGRLGVMTWAGLEHNPWMTCLGMAVMANGVPGVPPPTAPGGVFSLADPAALAGLVEAAGFSDTTVATADVVFEAPSAEAHVEQVASLAGPLAAVLRAAPPDTQAAVRRTAAELAAPYVTASGVAIPGRALLVTARA